MWNLPKVADTFLTVIHLIGRGKKKVVHSSVLRWIRNLRYLGKSNLPLKSIWEWEIPGCYYTKACREWDNSPTLFRWLLYVPHGGKLYPLMLYAKNANDIRWHNQLTWYLSARPLSDNPDNLHIELSDKVRLLVSREVAYGRIAQVVSSSKGARPRTLQAYADLNRLTSTAT